MIVDVQTSFRDLAVSFFRVYTQTWNCWTVWYFCEERPSQQLYHFTFSPTVYSFQFFHILANICCFLVCFFLYIPGILIRLMWYHIVVCFFWFLFVSPFHMACGLSSLRGTERLNLAAAVKVPSSNHWTAKEFPPGSFDLHFPNDWWCWAPFHVLIGSLQISFWEMCI